MLIAKFIDNFNIPIIKYKFMQTIFLNIKFKLIIFLIIGTLFSTACKKDNCSNSKLDNDIYFQVEHINFAWGYTHIGAFIDKNGNILRYDLSNNLPNDWVYADSLGYISSSDLLSNINKAIIDSQINVDTLNMKAALISQTINGALSDIEYLGADVGQSGYYCYYWDSDKNKYKRQLLFETGDREQYNTNTQAVELTRYLKQIFY